MTYGFSICKRKKFVIFISLSDFFVCFLLWVRVASNLLVFHRLVSPRFCSASLGTDQAGMAWHGIAAIPRPGFSPRGTINPPRRTAHAHDMTETRTCVLFSHCNQVGTLLCHSPTRPKYMKRVITTISEFKNSQSQTDSF